ncbi:MAG: hypothetical protein HQL27_07655 [Candidatus Omnitrophica bacterium]|nr:hypothetical protein [Candidatus Omnitrophota bacterium]
MSVNINQFSGKKRIILQGIFDRATFDSLKEGKVDEVFVLEGRPNLDPGKKSCRELIKRGIKPIIITDNMSGFLFYKKMVKEVWISCEIVNKYGALCYVGAIILGVLGKRHKVKVNVFLNEDKLKLIGHHKDIKNFLGNKVAPDNVRGYVPMAEWVPQNYFDEIYY